MSKRKSKTVDELLTKGRLLVFDLETSGLEANRAHIMCAAAKFVGDKDVFTARIDKTKGYGKTPESFYNDSQIVKELVALCNSADAVIAYYGDYGRFDVPYLNTRAMANNLEPCAPLTVIDPHKTARRSLKLARNSLDAVATLLDTKHQKWHLPWPEWQRAKFGDRKALDKLEEYCVNDVLVLEDVYLKLRPLIKNHPYVGPLPADAIVAGTAGGDVRPPAHSCPACGSAKTYGHGWRRTKNFVIHRQKCENCGTVFEASRRKVQ